MKRSPGKGFSDKAPPRFAKEKDRNEAGAFEGNF